MGDSELPELLERSVEFWGDAYVRVSYALGVLQHVTDEQRECTLFLEARAERAQRAAAAAAPAEQGVERLLLRAEASAVVEAGCRRGARERRPSAAQPARVPSAGATKAEEPPAAAAARASSQRPLALPEPLRSAAAALAARGVRPGTTLGCYADSCVPAGSPEADAFLARLAAARLRPPPAPPAAADRLTPAAAEEALRWELRALEGGGVDWQRQASLETSHAELCTAAHTVGHVLRCARPTPRHATARHACLRGRCGLTILTALPFPRLHAELCAALRLREEHARRAVRWRDQAMRCVMREGGAAEEAALQHPPHAAELWLPPDAWALLPAGDPAQLWPVAEDAPLTCTVRPPRVLWPDE